MNEEADNERSLFLLNCSFTFFSAISIPRTLLTYSTALAPPMARYKTLKTNLENTQEALFCLHLSSHPSSIQSLFSTFLSAYPTIRKALFLPKDLPNNHYYGELLVEVCVYVRAGSCERDVR